MDSSSWEKPGIEPTDDEVQQILNEIVEYRMTHKIDTEVKVERLDEQELRSCAMNLFPLYDRLYQKIEDLSVWNDYFEEMVVLAVIDDVDFRMYLFEQYETSTPAGKYLMDLFDSRDNKYGKWMQKNAQQSIQSSGSFRSEIGNNLNILNEITTPSKEENNRMARWCWCTLGSMTVSMFFLAWGGVFSFNLWILAIAVLMLELSVYCGFQMLLTNCKVGEIQVSPVRDTDDPFANQAMPLKMMTSEYACTEANRKEAYLGEKGFYILICRNVLMFMIVPIAQMVANKNCRRFLLKPSFPFVFVGAVVVVFVTISLIINIRKRRQNR